MGMKREELTNPTEALLPDEITKSLEKAVSVESCHTIEVNECDETEIGFGFGDAVFTSFAVAPLVVGVWRGTWGLIELHSDLFPYAQLYILGIIIHTSFALVRAQLLARSTGAWRKEGRAGRWLLERVLSRIYTYIFILSCVMQWKGGFSLLDVVVQSIVGESDPHVPVLYAASTAFFYICMLCLRSSRNFLASPYFLVTDGKEATYLFTTRFRSTSSRETILHVLDCIFSVCVVGSLVVFVWRGSWALLDIFLYPDDQIKSFWTSMILGYSLVIATFSLQAPIRWAAARLHGAPLLLLADVYHLISFVATINVWRGVWGLLDVYLFPDTPKLSNWCSHIVSLALLMLLNCSNSVIVRGVYIDAEEPAGECVVFPCHYLRLFFHKERTKKRHKRALAAAAAASRKAEDSSVPLQMPEDKV